MAEEVGKFVRPSRGRTYRAASPRHRGIEPDKQHPEEVQHDTQDTDVSSPRSKSPLLSARGIDQVAGRLSTVHDGEGVIDQLKDVRSHRQSKVNEQNLNSQNIPLDDMSGSHIASLRPVVGLGSEMRLKKQSDTDGLDLSNNMAPVRSPRAFRNKKLKEVNSPIRSENTNQVLANIAASSGIQESDSTNPRNPIGGTIVSIGEESDAPSSNGGGKVLRSPRAQRKFVREPTDTTSSAISAQTPTLPRNVDCVVADALADRASNDKPVEAPPRAIVANGTSYYEAAGSLNGELPYKGSSPKINNAAPTDATIGQEMIPLRPRTESSSNARPNPAPSNVEVSFTSAHNTGSGAGTDVGITDVNNKPISRNKGASKNRLNDEGSANMNAQRSSPESVADCDRVQAAIDLHNTGGLEVAAVDGGSGESASKPSSALGGKETMVVVDRSSHGMSEDVTRSMIAGNALQVTSEAQENHDMEGESKTHNTPMTTTANADALEALKQELAEADRENREENEGGDQANHGEDGGAFDRDAGQDDMYGGAFDCGWMESFKGKSLALAAEVLITRAMLKRDDVNGPAAWRGVIEAPTDLGTADESNDANKNDPFASLFQKVDSKYTEKKMTVAEFRSVWSSFNNPLKEEILAALCIRFGPAYAKFEGQLTKANSSSSSSASSVSGTMDGRSMRHAWNGYHMKNVSGSCHGGTEIDLRKLGIFLARSEAHMDVIEVQVTRGIHVFEDDYGATATRDVLSSVLSQIGMTAVFTWQLAPIIASALVHARKPPDAQVSLGELALYCMARATRIDEDGNSPMAGLYALLNPLNPSWQRALNDATAAAENDRENLIDPSDAAATQLDGIVPPICRHPLTFLAVLPKVGEGAVSGRDLLPLLAAKFPSVPYVTVRSVVSCFCDLEANTAYFTGSAQTVGVAQRRDVEKFFFPSGLTFTVKSAVGNFTIRGGRLKIMDSLGAVYQTVSKQLFAGLRKVRFMDLNLRIPSDVKLYLDPNHKAALYSGRRELAINVIAPDCILYAYSPYVAETLEQDKLLAAADTLHHVRPAAGSSLRPISAPRIGTEGLRSIATHRDAHSGKYGTVSGQQQPPALPRSNMTLPTAPSRGDRTMPTTGGHPPTAPTAALSAAAGRSAATTATAAAAAAPSSGKGRIPASSGALPTSAAPYVAPSAPLTSAAPPPRYTAASGYDSEPNTSRSRISKSKPPIRGLSDEQRVRVTLDRLLSEGPPVYLPAPAPFPHAEHTAHTWGIPVTVKYLREELEMSEQFEDAFLRSEMTGYRFICMDESRIPPVDDVSSLHTAKLLAHAKKLRDAVLERAFIQRPLQPDHWDTCHVAAWLQVKHECYESALCVLQKQLTGDHIKSWTDDQLLYYLGGAESPEAKKSLNILKKVYGLRRKSSATPSSIGVLPSTGNEAANIAPADGAAAGASATERPKEKVRPKSASAAPAGKSTAIKMRRAKERSEENSGGGGGDISASNPKDTDASISISTAITTEAPRVTDATIKAAAGAGPSETPTVQSPRENAEDSNRDEALLREASKGEMGKEVLGEEVVSLITSGDSRDAVTEEKERKSKKKMKKSKPKKGSSENVTIDIKNVPNDDFDSEAELIIVPAKPETEKEVEQQMFVKPADMFTNASKDERASKSKKSTGKVKPRKSSKSKKIAAARELNDSISEDSDASCAGNDSDEEIRAQRKKQAEDFERERRAFEEKIASLQRVVDGHSQSVAELKDLANTLRRENAEIQRRAAIDRDTLTASRDAAASALQRVADKYVEDVTSAKEVIKLQQQQSTVLRTLPDSPTAASRQQSMQKNVEVVGSATNDRDPANDGQKSSAIGVASITNASPTSSRARTQVEAPVAPPSIETDVSRSGNGIIAPPPAVVVSVTVDAKELDKAVATKKAQVTNEPLPAEPTTADVAAVLKEALPSPEQLNSGLELTRDVSDEIAAWGRVLKIYQLPLFSPSTVAIVAKGEKADSSKAATGVAAIFGDLPGEQYDWHSGEGYCSSDSLALLRVVAIRWTRLGLKMQDHLRRLRYVRQPPPATEDSLEEEKRRRKAEKLAAAVAASAGGLQEEPEFSEEDILLQGKDWGVLQALRGLRKCAEQICMDWRDKKALSLNITSNQSDRNSFGTSATAVYERRKARMLTIDIDGILDEDDSDLDRSDVDPQDKNAILRLEQKPPASEKSEKMSEFEVAVAMVFALGLVRRLLQKNTNKFSELHVDNEAADLPAVGAGIISASSSEASMTPTEQAQLMHLFNQIRYGDLPMRELARGDIRQLMQRSLNMPAAKQSWDKFDAVCQLFDPEKKGFIKSESVFVVFRGLTPMANALPYQSITFSSTLPPDNTFRRSQSPTSQKLLSLTNTANKANAKGMTMNTEKQTQPNPSGLVRGTGTARWALSANSGTNITSSFGGSIITAIQSLKDSQLLIAQSGCQFLLTVAAGELARRASAAGHRGAVRALIDLVCAKAKDVPSLGIYLEMETKKSALLRTSADDDTPNGRSVTPTAGRSLSVPSAARDTQVIVDILQELLTPFFSGLDDYVSSEVLLSVSPENELRVGFGTYAAFSATDMKRLIARSRPREGTTTKRPRSGGGGKPTSGEDTVSVAIAQELKKYLAAACDSLALSLRVYEKSAAGTGSFGESGSSTSAWASLHSLAAILVLVSNFRRACLAEFLPTEDPSNDSNWGGWGTTSEASATAEKKSVRSKKVLEHFTDDELKATVAIVEQQAKELMRKGGDDYSAEIIMQRMEALPIAVLQRHLAEVTGNPLPCGCTHERTETLIACQRSVEQILQLLQLRGKELLALRAQQEEKVKRAKALNKEVKEGNEGDKSPKSTFSKSFEGTLTDVRNSLLQEMPEIVDKDNDNDLDAAKGKDEHVADGKKTLRISVKTSSSFNTSRADLSTTTSTAPGKSERITLQTQRYQHISDIPMTFDERKATLTAHLSLLNQKAARRRDSVLQLLALWKRIQSAPVTEAVKGREQKLQTNEEDYSKEATMIYRDIIEADDPTKESIELREVVEQIRYEVDTSKLQSKSARKSSRDGVSRQAKELMKSVAFDKELNDAEAKRPHSGGSLNNRPARTTPPEEAAAAAAAAMASSTIGSDEEVAALGLLINEADTLEGSLQQSRKDATKLVQKILDALGRGDR